MMCCVLFGVVRAEDTADFELTVLENSVHYGVYDAADINGDGSNDIVGGGSGNVWWSDCSTPAQRHMVDQNAAVGYEIHSADIDNDGDMDILTSGDGITWWENPLLPDGKYPSSDSWTKHSFGSHGTSMAGGSHDFTVGDINGDGRIDAVERDREATFWVYFQKESDNDVDFDVVTFDTPNSIEGTVLGDIDGDGDLDISDGWSWFECPADPIHDTWHRHDFGGDHHGKMRVAIGDISGDEKLDVVVAPAEFGGNKTLWYEAPSDPKNGEWTPHMLYSRSDPNFHTLEVGDIDADGTTDILLGTTAYHDEPWGKRITILYNRNGDGSVWDSLKWHTEDGVWQANLVDVGSDGDLDILNADYHSGVQGEFWENTKDPVGIKNGGRMKRCPRRDNQRFSIQVKRKVFYMHERDHGVFIFNRNGDDAMTLYNCMGRSLQNFVPYK